MCVLEGLQSPEGSSHGKQAFCQSSAEHLSASLIKIIHAFLAIVSVAGFVMP